MHSICTVDAKNKTVVIKRWVFLWKRCEKTHFQKQTEEAHKPVCMLIRNAINAMLELGLFAEPNEFKAELRMLKTNLSS